MTIKTIINKVKKNYPDADVDVIQKAFDFAQKAHIDQKRMTGEKFIEHPLHVAQNLADIRMDPDTIAASLLHDVVEDTPTRLEQIKNKFGENIANLVDGVTKLKRIKLQENNKEYSIENLRKMFISMANDIRVILIKLMDRLDNLETLSALPEEKQKYIAKETIEIYAPIANRLGMGEIKGKLEDAAFPFVYPEEYNWIKGYLTEECKEREKYIKKVKKIIKKELKKMKAEYLDIHGRAKHIYSLYRKLLKHDMDISKIYDLVALRIIVKNVGDCYKTLGIIHKIWKPLPGRIKDYIAFPKPNGYQSLHTTVFAVDNKITEIQIRTEKMHQEAEWGVAAQWYYDLTKYKGKKIVPHKFEWIKKLIGWQKVFRNRDEFSKSLKIDIFEDRIFVFTPTGDVIDLPEGATPIDFAYEIHTDLGHRATGTKINDKIVSLDYKLKNGDTVEILTGKKYESPSRDWLKFVKTNVARSKIRRWFKKSKREEYIDIGASLLNQELEHIKNIYLDKISKKEIKIALKRLKYKDIDDLLISVGKGDIKPQQVIKNIYFEENLYPEIKKARESKTVIPKIMLDGQKDILTNIAKCCKPTPQDEIIGYITKEKGATIHKKDCKNIRSKDKKKIVSAEWVGVKTFPAEIEIKSWDRIGLLKDVTAEIANAGINIADICSHNNPDGSSLILVNVEVKGDDELEKICKNIKEVNSVIDVKIGYKS